MNNYHSNIPQNQSLLTWMFKSTLEDIIELLDDVTQYKTPEELSEAMRDKIKSYQEKFKISNSEIYEFFNSVEKQFFTEDAPHVESQAGVVVSDTFNVIDTEDLYTSDNNQFKSASHNSVNQIVRKTVKHTLNVDSRFRTSRDTTYSHNFDIKLPSGINNVIEMKLCDIEFPVTYYPVASEYYTNYFWIKRVTSTSEEYFYINFTDSVYSKERFIETFNTAMVESNINLQFELDVVTTYGISEGTGKLKINHSIVSDDSTDNFEDETFTIKFNAPPYEQSVDDIVVLLDSETAETYYDTNHSVYIQDKLGWMMGFQTNTVSIEDVAYGDAIMELSGARYFYICINDFNGNLNETYYSSSKYEVLRQNIMARIKITGDHFSIMKPNSDGFVSNPRYFGTVNLEKINVKIYDDHNRLLNLNNNDISFTIEVKTIYQSKNDL